MTELLAGLGIGLVIAAAIIGYCWCISAAMDLADAVSGDDE